MEEGCCQLFSPSFEKLCCCVSFYLMQKWQKEGGRRKASISDTTEGNMGGGWGGGLVVSGLWPFCAIWMVQKAKKQPEHLCYSLRHYDNENSQMLRGINNISSFLRLYKRNIYSIWKRLCREVLELKKKKNHNVFTMWWRRAAQQATLTRLFPNFWLPNHAALIPCYHICHAHSII